MTHKISGVCVEEYAYYVNKLHQNVGLETCLWRHVVMSQGLPTTNKWPPYATEWNPPWKISAYATGFINDFHSSLWFVFLPTPVEIFIYTRPHRVCHQHHGILSSAQDCTAELPNISSDKRPNHVWKKPNRVKKAKLLKKHEIKNYLLVAGHFRKTKL